MNKGIRNVYKSESAVIRQSILTKMVRSTLFIVVLFCVVFGAFADDDDDEGCTICTKILTDFNKELSGKDAQNVSYSYDVKQVSFRYLIVCATISFLMKKTTIRTVRAQLTARLE
jgi:hypothetical protein